MNDKDLKCEICLVHYDLQFFVPICIPCGHTMCFPCLKDRYKKEGKIKCINDEKTFSLKPELYAKNYYIIKLLQNKKLGDSARFRDNSNNEDNFNSFRNPTFTSSRLSGSNKIGISDYSSYESYEDSTRNKKNLVEKEKVVNPFTSFISNSTREVNNNSNKNFDSNSKVNFIYGGESNRESK